MKRLLLLALALIASPAFAAKPPIIAVIDETVKENAGSVTVPIVRSGDLGRVTTFTWKTVDYTAVAGTNYTAKSGSGSFPVGAGEADLTIDVRSDGMVTGAKVFRVQVTPDRGTGVNGLVTILNTDVAAPPPAPAPVTTGYVPSPTLDGAAYVSDGTDGSQALQASWGNGAIPNSAAPDVVGAFRFICQAGQVLADDPIVYPGQPGKSHLHQFYGNDAANASSTYTSLRTTGQSTCNRGVAIPGNRSGYWMPAMLDANGQVVKPDFVSIYYKRRPASDPKCTLGLDPQAEGNCVPIPNGLRFIFGYDMLTGKPPTGEAYFNCQGPSAKPGAYPDIPTALANCPVGNQLGAVITAPTCWDGKNLDSPNHRDHIAYAGYGDWGYLRCDSAHPYVIPEFKLGAWYPVVDGMHLSCDPMVPGKPAGTCFHADYWEAWDQTVKIMWTRLGCIDRFLNCSGGDLGNGLQLKGAQ